MARITLSLTPESTRVIARHRAGAAALRRQLGAALRQGLYEAEAHLKITYLRGGDAKTPRGGQPPLAVRSGALLGDTTHQLDQPLSGWVGVASGRSTRYARTVLGKGTTTIRPRNAKHLWVPIADNLDAGGRMRLSPTQVMSATNAKGKKAVRFITGASGKTVVALETKVPGVRRQDLKFMFVLRDQVEVEGTDALATAVSERTDRIEMLLRQAAAAAFGGGA